MKNAWMVSDFPELHHMLNDLKCYWSPDEPLAELLHRMVDLHVKWEGLASEGIRARQGVDAYKVEVDAEKAEAKRLFAEAKQWTAEADWRKAEFDKSQAGQALIEAQDALAEANQDNYQLKQEIATLKTIQASLQWSVKSKTEKIIQLERQLKANLKPAKRPTVKVDVISRFNRRVVDRVRFHHPAPMQDHLL